MGKLELLTDSVLFDRNNKIAVLSAAGRALLPEVRRLVDDADALAVRARRFAAGVEPRLAVCIDAVFPVSGVVAVAKAFAKAFADVELALFTESLSAVTALVRGCFVARALSPRTSAMSDGPSPRRPMGRSVHTVTRTARLLRWCEGTHGPPHRNDDALR